MDSETFYRIEQAYCGLLRFIDRAYASKERDRTLTCSWTTHIAIPSVLSSFFNLVNKDVQERGFAITYSTAYFIVYLEVSNTSLGPSSPL